MKKPADRVRLHELLKANRALFVVYVLKDDLKQLWRFRYPGAARRFWKQWHRRAMSSRLPALMIFAKQQQQDQGHQTNGVRLPGRRLLLPQNPRCFPRYSVKNPREGSNSPRGSADAFLFLHPWTGRPLSRKRAWERLLLAGRAAGLADAVIGLISPRKLRHARAFHALADGMTITDVQGLLDHEDVRTMTIYVEANEAQRFSTMEQLSRAGVLRR